MQTEYVVSPALDSLVGTRIQADVDLPRSKTATARYRQLSLLLVVTDIACFAAAMQLSYLLRFGSRPVSPHWLVLVAVMPLLWVAVFHAYGLYARARLTAIEEIGRTLSASSVGMVLVMITSFWTNASLSRVWVAVAWAMAILFELGSRGAWRWWIDKLKARGDLDVRTLIVGTNAEACSLARELQEPGLGFNPLGYVAVARSDRSSNGLGVVGEVGNLVDVIRATQAECVFVAQSAMAPEQILTVAQHARRAGVEVRVSANLPEILTSRTTPQPIGGVVSLTLRPVRLSGTQAFLKRVFDVVLSGTVLLLLSPLMIAIAVLIKVTSRQRPLFRQERVTKNGQIFRMLKFRTMVDADPANLTQASESVAFFKSQEDPRTTAFGRKLRRFSLDELPQLINVLKGEMSLVGPRPLPLGQVRANEDLLAPRHEVKAGVTGWWQVNGRSDINAAQAVRMDLYYIENWSISLDLYILAKTAGAILAGRGAY